MNEEIIYLDCAGKENRDTVVDIIKKTVEESKFKYLVVPTSTGKSIDLIIEKNIHKNISVIAVIIHNGFVEIDKNKIEKEKLEEYRKNGIEIFQGSHSLSGIERAISRKFGGISSVEIIAAALKIFGGDGIKVAVEIAVMAADGGLVPTTEEILVAGGTSGGLDTLVSMKAAHMNNFFDLNISKIYVKPLKRVSL